MDAMDFPWDAARRGRGPDAAAECGIPDGGQGARPPGIDQPRLQFE
jgi:hypothetical protein